MFAFSTHSFTLLAFFLVVAKYDMEWGRKYFENVLLLIRDIANPSVKDLYFPSFRQKDWYLGNSWASGIGTYGGRKSNSYVL